MFDYIPHKGDTVQHRETGEVGEVVGEFQPYLDVQWPGDAAIESHHRQYLRVVSRPAGSADAVLAQIRSTSARHFENGTWD